MSICKCGCGNLCEVNYKRGHYWKDRSRGKFSKERISKFTRDRNDSSTVPKATRKPSLGDLNWLAGFIEGEGTFKKSQSSCQIAITQVNKEPLIKVQELLGGTLSFRKRGKSNTGNQSDYWQWYVSGARARGIMFTLFSLMSSKRKEQIKKALL